jgi:hypothetical protein
LKISFPRSPLAVLLLLSSALTLPAGATPLSTQKATQDMWAGLYFNGRKIGYSHVTMAPATYKGKSVLRINSVSEAHIEMFGKKVDQVTKGFTYTDSTYKPLYSENVISSNGSVLNIKADYQPGKILCTVNSGGTPVHKEVPVPSGANLAADSPDSGMGKRMKPGQKVTYYYLEPLSLTLQKTDIEVQAKEKVQLAGTAYNAIRVQATMSFGALTSWETEAGDLLKSEMPLGMAMFRESKAIALSMTSTAPKFAVLGSAGSSIAKTSYKPPKDFALATAVTTDKPINNPRDAKTVSLTIRGVEDPKLILSDSRQQYKEVGDKENVWALTVRAEKFDPASSVSLPIDNPDVQALAQRAPYLETDDPQIKKIADEVKGSETNAYRVAVKIHDWVNSHMTPDYSIGVPRSCAEIIGKRRGVCRDYATLYAGIARAAGIPTRVCAGIVYAEGHFFYHAWAESWVGAWVPFDPTMKGSDFVDATHIKFAQGDVTDMFQVAGIIGRIKVTVQNVE